MFIEFRKWLTLELFLLFLWISHFSWVELTVKSPHVYCALKHCASQNIACEPAKNFSRTCPNRIQIVDTDLYQNTILNIMNTFRNKVAQGYTKNLLPAARMSVMSWSKELEKFAMLYIMKCSPKEIFCMSSPEFTNIGSVYDGLTFKGHFVGASVPELVEGLIEGWLEDTRFVTRSMLTKLTPNFVKKSVSRVVLLMTDRNSHLGCSAVTFIKHSIFHFNIACAFATENMKELPIYTVSKNPGLRCKHRDKNYKFLCAPGENYKNSHDYKEGELLESAEETYLN